MPTDYRVISIGTLSNHPLWDSQGDPRTPHATTTLVVAGDQRVLVNPALPPPLLEVRMQERCGRGLADITDVFLTSFYPDHRRGLAALEHATWHLAEAEHSAMRTFLETEQLEAHQHGDTERLSLVDDEQRLLDRCVVAADSIAPGVDLFPLPGISPGCCGLLLPQPRQTVLICGDAVATMEHHERAMVLPECWNREQAIESFQEALEIADVLIPGRDNTISC